MYKTHNFLKNHQLNIPTRKSGIGPLTASALTTELGDINRFKTLISRAVMLVLFQG